MSLWALWLFLHKHFVKPTFQTRSLWIKAISFMIFFYMTKCMKLFCNKKNWFELTNTPKQLLHFNSHFTQTSLTPITHNHQDFGWLKSWITNRVRKKIRRLKHFHCFAILMHFYLLTCVNSKMKQLKTIQRELNIFVH